MIVEYIRYKIADDRRSDFEDAYRRADAALVASPNCLRYELSRCVEDPSYYILRIEWDSIDGHMQGFRRSPEFREFYKPVRPYVGNIEQMRHYELTGLRSDEG